MTETHMKDEYEMREHTLEIARKDMFEKIRLRQEKNMI